MTIVVSDTSPLNYLILIGHVDLLPALFSTVLIPRAVVDELQAAVASAKVRDWIKSRPSWLKIVDPREIDVDAKLGAGERAAIALALEAKADRILIDERLGREIAAGLGLRVAGLLGVLDEAADRGLIELKPALDALAATSFRVRRDLLELLLQKDRARRPAEPL